MQRPDDFATRRQHLADLTEEELEKRFWELANSVVDPSLDLARTHTTPSIERSVLLRMGLDSLTAKGIVERALAKGILGHGAGHCVLFYSQFRKISIVEAGEELSKGEGWETLESFFSKGAH